MKKVVTVALVLIALFGCLWLSRPSTSSEEHLIQDFPLIIQPDGFTCGPTSIAMVLKYYGKEHSVAEVRKIALTDFLKVHWKGEERRGSYPLFIPTTFWYYGIHAKMKQGDLAELKSYISQDRPVVVIVRSWKYGLHYVVVIGYTKDTITLADPGDGSYFTLPVENFMRAWKLTHEYVSGEDMTEPCFLCHGKGKLFDVGPLGICELCGGTGRLSDLYLVLVKTMQTTGNWMTVPDKRD